MSGPLGLLLGPGCSEPGGPLGRMVPGALPDRSPDSCELSQAAPLMGGGCRAPTGLLSPACEPAASTLHTADVHTSAVHLRSPTSRGQYWSDHRGGKGGGRKLAGVAVGGPTQVIPSVGLSVSLLGAGWAAALSLLVIHRAGMANQASAEPGSRVGRVGSSWVCGGEGSMGFEHALFLISQQSSPGSVQGGLPFPKRCLNAPPPPESFKSKW